MNDEIKQTFDELEVLRNEYFKTTEFNGETHKRARADKWSIGEFIYHCYLLMKLTRQASAVYLPVSRFLINVSRFKAKEYNGEMENIYAGPTMKALKFLEPDMNRRYSKGELRLMLEEETGN